MGDAAQEVVQGVFIGSRESAELRALHSRGISAVVSVGCPDPREEDLGLETREKLSYLCFPQILDTPESIILHIFIQTSEFICAHRKEGRGVLVHCIYGQSRSATILAAYLMSTGLSLESSLTVLKEKIEQICINPGFIAQLYVYDNRYQYPIEMTLIAHRGIVNSEDSNQSLSLFLASYNSIHEDLERRHYADSSRVLVCPTCQYKLANQHHILTKDDAKLLEDSLCKFVTSHVDDFWKGYRSAHGIIPLCTASSIEPGSVVLEPQMWMFEQTIDSKLLNNIGKRKLSPSTFYPDKVLSCPQCGQECGNVQKRCLSMCLSYILVDCFVLHKKFFRKKRFLNKNKV